LDPNKNLDPNCLWIMCHNGECDTIDTYTEYHTVCQRVMFMTCQSEPV